MKQKTEKCSKMVHNCNFFVKVIFDKSLKFLNAGSGSALIKTVGSGSAKKEYGSTALPVPIPRLLQHKITSNNPNHIFEMVS